MTIDEQISGLEETLRRLKIEYDVYFGGGSKRSPTDTEWRVSSAIKKLSDGQKLSFPQRFKFNAIAQRYAIFSDLWRQKLKIKEEGYRRPQDAILGIQGLRPVQADEPASSVAANPFSIEYADSEIDADKLQRLYEVMMEARRRSGETVKEGATFEKFKVFVHRKTEQLRSEYGCRSVEYTVEVQDGLVRLKAKALI